MAELKRHWPFGKFPLLVDDGEPVIETTCIIEHLQAHHPGPNVWIPDGELGPRVRFLDRFFDNYVHGQHAAGGQPCPAPGRHEAIAYGAEQGAQESAHRLRLARGEPARATAGRPATASRWPIARRAPSLFYADWVEEIGDGRPKLKAYRARLLAHPVGRTCGRRGSAVPALFPARRARPRLSEAGGFPQQLIGLDHFAELASWLRSPPFLSG